MNVRSPVSTPIRLLEWLLPDAEALAGDLLEQAADGRSSMWLWHQVITAVVCAYGARRMLHDVRPLRLTDDPPPEVIERSRRWAERATTVNLTASPIAGIGGLGLLAMGILVSVVVPTIWLVVAASLLLGSVLGAAMVVAHHVSPRRSNSGSPWMLR